MISVQQAKQIINETIPAAKPVLLPLQECLGRVISEPIIAPYTIPAFPQSSMDGYAVAFEEGRQTYICIGEAPAGSNKKWVVQKGEAVRIFTGGPLPEGADTIIMQEKVTRTGNLLSHSDKHIVLGQHVRPIGAEIVAGDVAMVTGEILTPAAIGFLAGIGCSNALVWQPPTVGILLTGNELQEVGKQLDFGQVYESNSFALQAALEELGIREVKVYKSIDDSHILKQVILQALEAVDILLLTGGVSVGDYDYVPQTLEACGVTKEFHRVLQKPGKPLYYGRKNQKLIWGLPGNPSSSLTCFYEYVAPVINSLQGKANSVKIEEAVLSQSFNKSAGLTHFVKAYFENGIVTPLGAQESFRMHSYSRANCLIVLSESQTHVAAGERVEIHLFA